jgi:FAD/FMN-containing dehydrogenase
MSAKAMEFVRKHGRARVPLAEAAATCFVLLDVSTAEAGRAQSILELLLSDALSERLISDAQIATSQAQRNALWQMREQMSDIQKYEGGSIKHDVSLPVARVPEFLERAAVVVEELCPGARPVPFGHLGDGNVHYNVSQPEGMDTTRYLDLWDPMSSRIHDIVVEMDGSISAEHGIGRMKRGELQRLKDPVALDLMRRIKAVFDPNGILNPGKVL